MTSTKESVQIQLQPFLLARSNFYQFLHLLFAEPIDDDRLTELSKAGKFNDLKFDHEGGKILADFFENMTRNKNVMTEKEEYRRLFIGPGTLIAPPWESYYRSEEGLLFEEWTFQIRELFHQYGLQNIHENNEPDDSLFLELEFMIFLIHLSLQTEETKEIKDLISSQIHLLKDHMTIWIPEFCQRIIDHSNSRLYIGAAMLLKEFLIFDLTSLLEVKEALEYV
ncbi:TorD/DmsD family molecular chaperone [Bacillus sp. USDA818B3_A]|uniref:TorD/DmsD family molecular chaperone n=1 Tax=Bacillus sp. USDA818B3_A TaxID=2698834 RepID=UPI0013695722|nr:molecular chaperone TorD family protein [Bacillus sp. USDA818B3_A]